LLVLLGCLQLAGGPYSLMQVYAWVGMLVTYSQNDGIIQATKDTFSGEKPCKLCCKIEAAREPAKDQPVAPISTSVSVKQLQEMIPAGQITALSPPSPRELSPITFPRGHLFHDAISASPPTPPPRVG
jgi:hypothetical protein